MTFHDQIQSMLSDAASESEYWELAGITESDTEEPHPYDLLQNALESGLRELKTLREHRHEWGENDYCVICGADGRA